MDPRVFNLSVLAGLVMVGVGVGLALSWQWALVADGLILIRGAFAAAALAPQRSE